MIGAAGKKIPLLVMKSFEVGAERRQRERAAISVYRSSDPWIKLGWVKSWGAGRGRQRKGEAEKRTEQVGERSRERKEGEEESLKSCP